MQTRKLAVIGQGYVGLPLAMRAVEVGFHVVGVESDPYRVARLAAADSYVGDVTGSALRGALETGRFQPTVSYDDAAGFDVAVITVPTPLREGTPDLSHIEAAGRALAPLVRPGTTVVLESTTYPGTTQDLLQPILERGSGLSAGPDFALGYSPERIDPGNPVYGLVNTPKVVSGIDGRSLVAVQEFFDEIVERTVPVSSPREAELAKLLENTFRHVNIALVNELAVFAHELGIDIWEVIDAAATKPFGFMPFTPGPGVGGHCLPIDPSYLSWQVKRALGHSFRFVELANDVNDHMPDYVVQRLMLALNDRGKALNGSRLLLLGLAYKKNTGDARESPAARIAELLAGLGADVHAADPYVDAAHVPIGVEMVELTMEEVSAADAVVILAEHEAFDLSLLADATVFDTRHVLKPRPGVEHL
jgi:UDP-N-acetyl-D-mannosaminuronic acid dehydrogenase/UDP-N-acetyl-D-glucosamine dehydrogenase